MRIDVLGGAGIPGQAGFPGAKGFPGQVGQPGRAGKWNTKIEMLLLSISLFYRQRRCIRCPWSSW